MSTTKPKLYTLKDIESAKTNNNAVKRYFARKCKRRKTKQIRIGQEWHDKVKDLAVSEDMVMSFLLDEICKHFFSNYK